MGYETYITGHLYIRPKLTDEHLAMWVDDGFGQLSPPDYNDYFPWQYDKASGSFFVDDSIKAYNFDDHVENLIAHYADHTFNGDIYGDGDSSDDLWVMRVRNNVVNSYDAETTYPGGPDLDPAVLEAPARAGW